MGLADFIEQVNESQETGNTYEKASPSLQVVSNIGSTQKKIILEKLNFLRPCPLCQGRYFTYGQKGGFFCDACQPGIAGSPVYATGKERQKVQPVESVETQAQSQEYSAQPRDINQENECFRIGFLWITENLNELLACGWTKPELFRRSRHKWCMGAWGLAWLSIWRRPDLVVEIKPTGSVLFIFPSGGRVITQAAYPEKKVSIPQQTHS